MSAAPSHMSWLSRLGTALRKVGRAMASGGEQRAHLDGEHWRHSRPLMIAHGLGGEMHLHAEHVEILHFGVLHMLVEFLTFHTPRISTRIRLDQITALECIRPVILPDYLIISYAGAPEPETGYLRRAFAANALIMSYINNRDFYALLSRLMEQKSDIRALNL